MDFLSKYFDHYVISARIKPAFFVVLPLAVTAIVWWPEVWKLGGAVMMFLATFGAVGFFSNLISNLGNELQVRLFSEWGGAPTTALLRFGNSQLDPYTKERYRRQLETLIPGLKMPSHEQEQADPSNADACYGSATNFLREHTRNKANYPMVYADNVAYGYARNLLVLKRFGVAASALGILVNIALLKPTITDYLTMAHPQPMDTRTLLAIGAIAVCIAMLWLFTVMVNKKYVRGRAERYAKSLLSACERISG